MAQQLAHQQQAGAQAQSQAQTQPQAQAQQQETQDSGTETTAAPAVAQRPKLPEYYLRKANDAIRQPPTQLADKSADSIKWMKEMKKRFAKALMTMDTTKNNVNNWEKLINDRIAQGNPLKDEDFRKFQLKRDQQVKLYSEARKWVEGVRKQQENWRNPYS